jgi:hypothetical protein
MGEVEKSACINGYEKERSFSGRAFLWAKVENLACIDGCGKERSVSSRAFLHVKMIGFLDTYARARFLHQ